MKKVKYPFVNVTEFKNRLGYYTKMLRRGKSFYLTVSNKVIAFVDAITDKN